MASQLLLAFQQQLLTHPRGHGSAFIGNIREVSS